MAERLTEINEFGNADIIGVDTLKLFGNLKPMEFLQASNALDKLAHYEGLAEQGRLIELPCAVGDTVWTIDPDMTFIDDFKVTDIDIMKEGIAFCNHYLGYLFYVNDFGKIVFLTKEEAEAKLKERGGAENEIQKEAYCD